MILHTGAALILVLAQSDWVRIAGETVRLLLGAPLVFVFVGPFFVLLVSIWVHRAAAPTAPPHATDESFWRGGGYEPAFDLLIVAFGAVGARVFAVIGALESHALPADVQSEFYTELGLFIVVGLALIGLLILATSVIRTTGWRETEAGMRPQSGGPAASMVLSTGTLVLTLNVLYTYRAPSGFVG